jgi:hypothetical protein
MKTASSQDIKQELVNLPPKKVIEICLRLARFKKENKELLHYLLFEADHEEGYVETIKHELDEQFDELPKPNWYLTKKGLRRVLRTISKYSKYLSKKESEAELIIHFCKQVKEKGIMNRPNQALTNIYHQQLNKLNKLVELVHEDLQFDYRKQLNELQ